MITIKDVAKKAGVSKSTVSYVLSGKKPISDATKKRVYAVMEELGYKPSPIARSLAGSRTNIVTYYGPRFIGKRGGIGEAQFYASANSWNEVVQGIVSTLNPRGYRLLLETQRVNESNHLYCDFGNLPPMDGFIVYNLDLSHDQIFSFSDMKKPFVLVGKSKELSEFSSIDNDIVGMFQEATEYLIESGKKRILFINGPSEAQYYKERHTGYMMALNERGISVDSDLVRSGDYNQNTGYTVIKDILKKKIKFDAVLTAQDLIAVGVMNGLKEKNIAIPEDVAIIGSGNTVLSRTSSPGLTSIDYSAFEGGKKAANLLLAMIEGKVSDSVHMPISHQIVIREST